MDIETKILRKVESLATDILKNQLSPELTYHNYDHTRMVVDAVYEIGTAEKLKVEQLEIVLIAAWLHDTGYGDLDQDHEQRSKEIAEEILKAEGYPEKKIEKVGACIMVTKPGAVPADLLEKVICDADLSHLAMKNYPEHAAGLRQEWENVKHKKYTDLEWTQMSLAFVCNHKFKTSYGKETLSKRKSKVQISLEKTLKKLQKEADTSLVQELGVTQEELKSMKKKLLKATGRPERGIETMFRLTSKNHLTLSSMADSKANIMISVNSIIISILIGALMQKLDSNPHLIIPTFILLGVNLGSMIFSIFAIRPNVTRGLFTKEDIENHKTNLLFFGNFHKMERDDYHWGMNRLMENASFLYSSLIDDIYFLGVVLATKYKFLRASYNVFMFGIVIAVIAFVISIFLAENF